MFEYHDNIVDIKLKIPQSLVVHKVLEELKDQISEEVMLTFWLEEAVDESALKVTLLSWYKKRQKIFLLHYGSTLYEILVENNKIDYFLDIGVSGGGFSYEQILKDFFATVEVAHGPIRDCEMFFL